MKRLLLVFILLSSVFLIACDTVPNIGSNKCDDFAKSMIPEKVSFTGVSIGEVLSESDTFWDNGNYGPKNKWNDGTEMIYTDAFKKGSATGENTNYFYSYDKSGSFFSLVKSNSTIKYTKQIIAENGNILGDTTFGIMAVLKPIPNEFYVQDFTCNDVGKCLTHYTYQNFSIVNYQIVDCKYIEK